MASLLPTPRRRHDRRDPRLMYAPTLFLLIGLILGWLLCKGGVG